MNVTEEQLDALVIGVIDAALSNPTKQFISKSDVFADKKVQGCKYFYLDDMNQINYNNPCCIIGHAMVQSGLSSLVFDRLNNSARISALIYTGGTATYKKISWLDQVQELQDSGEIWSSAVLNTDKELLDVPS